MPTSWGIYFSMKLITIKVVPRSSRNEIIPLPDGSFRVKITAPPVDGAANGALLDFLNEAWKIPKSKLRIKKGLRGKNKVVEIEN